MNEKVSYQEVRSWFLECYYRYCQGKIIGQRKWMSGEFEFGYAYDQIYDENSLPAEKLMVHILAIILAAGRAPDVEKFHRGKISELLAACDFEDISNSVVSGELSELLQDMKMLEIPL